MNNEIDNSSAVVPFDFKGNQVRTMVIDGEPWFVAKDVCDVLGHKNPTVSIGSLDPDEKAKLFLGSGSDANIVNEPGLYSLILRSNKKEAKEFIEWVTSEVLPSIRKTGSYSVVTPVQPQLPNFNNPAEAARAWADEYEGRLIEKNRADEAERECVQESQRADEAIRTKAWIGDKRQASAMGTASAALKKVKMLEEQLGINGDYRTAKAIDWIPEYFRVKLPGTWQVIGQHCQVFT